MAQKSYYLMIDTETAGGLNAPLCYDVGIAIIDKKGIVYKSYSLVVAEIFYGEKKLMQSAYYANKIPMYYQHIKGGQKKVKSFWEIWRLILTLINHFNVKAVIAHNASFDEKAINNTLSYVSNGLYKTFIPREVPIWCTLSMARSTICCQPTYINWCKANGYLTAKGQPRATAEILYRYISHNNDFIESHTGLQDVLIEKEIFVRCLRQHKKMNKNPIYR